MWCDDTELTARPGLCSSCDRGRGVFTLSKHGRPLDWAVVAQEVWRWPDSQVNVDADVWQACLNSLGLASGKGTLFTVDQLPMARSASHVQGLCRRPAIPVYVCVLLL